jgi:hypothetical protein
MNPILKALMEKERRELGAPPVDRRIRPSNRGVRRVTGRVSTSRLLPNGGRKV